LIKGRSDKMQMMNLWRVGWIGRQRYGPWLLLGASILILVACNGISAVRSTEETMARLTVTQAENGKVIEVHPGDSIAIQLKENPTTGYTWAVDQGNDALLALQDSHYTQGPGMGVGGGGERNLIFQAQKAGTVPLQLKLWRSWVGDASITERFAITITIR
jgi:inhibitor of cysteine peptidase